ncbi:hypothetical protein [Kaarinaea lacus]
MKYVVMTLVFEKDVADLNEEEIAEYISALKHNYVYWSPQADAVKIVPMDAEELEVENANI